MASLGLKTYVDAAKAHLSVVAVHASAIASHPQLLAAQSAVADFATNTALPAVMVGVEATKANAAAAYAMTADLARPHALAAAQAVKVGPGGYCPPRHRHAVETLVLQSNDIP